MAWQYPASISTTDTVALDLGATDSAFIDEDVLIFSKSNVAILGTGDNHVVEVSGTVRSGSACISIGDPNANTEATGNTVFVDLGGKVENTGKTGAAVAFLGNGNLLVNDGEISSAFAGVYIKSDTMNANRIVNHGAIAGVYGVAGAEGLDETILRNSGRIEGTTASYGYQAPSAQNFCIDIIHNSGTMVGSVFLDANNDKYFGADGHLTGTLSGGEGNDELYDGAGGNHLDGGEGNDTIAGGAGADVITGGPGQDGNGTDTVIYYKTSDSTPKHFDVVTDISTSTGLDSLDFHLIDANTTKPGNQAFAFTGNHKPGSLWFDVIQGHGGPYMMLYGETDGDKQPDFCIKWLHHDQLGPGEIIF
jgi:Ca2+-binding RTX toxin-like protein